MKHKKIPTLNTIDQYKVIAKFLRHKEGKTKQAYKSALGAFFGFVKANPDEYFQVDIRKLENGARIDAIDKYTEDVENFWDSIRHTKSPCTISGYMGVVRVFFRYNHIDLDIQVLDDIKNQSKKVRPLTEEYPLTPELIAQILNHGRILEKAFFLSLISSGMRKGELLQVAEADIDMTQSPTKIHVIHDPENGRTVKNEESRFVFISDEATKFLRLWLKERDTYLQQACAKTHIITFHGKVTKSMDNDKIFPFSEDTAQVMWNRMCKQSGLYEQDVKTGYNKRRGHMLRKFFKSYFKTDDPQNAEYVEMLLGHSGYLNHTYFRPNEQQLADFYKKGMECVTIYDRPIENKELIEKQQKEIGALRKMVENLWVASGKKLDEDIAQKQADEEAYQVYRQQLADEQDAINQSNPPTQRTKKIVAGSTETALLGSISVTRGKPPL